MTNSSNDQYLKYDLYRYFYPDDQTETISFLGKLRLIVLTQGIWALIIYRAGFWCVRNSKRLGVLVRLLLPCLTVCQKIVEIATGIDIPFTARIGRGLYIGHFGQIILSTRTVMGEFCNLSQGVTIGEAGRGAERHVPRIGDRVYIAPGVKLFGKLTIGNDVAIGANAVVTRDLPDNAVAVGIPAKVINLESSRDFVNFNHRKMGIP
ncbi:MAG: serine acetyltransferase [Desulfuromonadaceae bacterium]|nr:serine acetyltransferase [Desulfuromonadaceae bacterium]MDD5104826.1 serine acetyltransferase [Desulfuromonadaceae bacterium]